MKYVLQVMVIFFRLQPFRILSWLVASMFLEITLHATTTNFVVQGVVKQINPADHQLVITHKSIPGYMEAMTMPFNVKDDAVPRELTVGATIRFEFHVNETESWIDGIKQIQSAPSQVSQTAGTSDVDGHQKTAANTMVSLRSQTSLRNFKFTNELGQPVSFSDFHGQAIAITFFFTRCPVPDFCPRLSRNFQQVEQKLSAMENGPTNWHLLSVSFDPARDTPEVLKAYAETYHYDPDHWSFLTGPADKISQLAHECGVEFKAEDGFFNHNFRTIIIDASNHLQMIFPTSGNLSGAIAGEVIKAARPATQNLESQTTAGRDESKN